MGNDGPVLLEITSRSLFTSASTKSHISRILAFGDISHTVPQNLEVVLRCCNTLRDRHYIGGDARGCLRTESITDGRAVGVRQSEPWAMAGKPGKSPPRPGALSAAPGPCGGIKGPVCPAPDHGPEGRRVRDRRTAVVWFGLEEGALWVPTIEGTEGKKKGRSEKKQKGV